MAEDETGEVPKLPPDARLESLDKRLDRLQQAEAKRTAKGAAQSERSARAAGLGQLSALPLGGFVIGWVLDKLARHAAVAVMLLMLFSGSRVGVRNVMRISKTRRTTPAGKNRGK